MRRDYFVLFINQSKTKFKYDSRFLRQKLEMIQNSPSFNSLNHFLLLIEKHCFIVTKKKKKKKKKKKRKVITINGNIIKKRKKIKKKLLTFRFIIQLL